ncbi:MAG: pseudouridine synthase [Legionellales bacterium]|nr:pseudouridine synthase [Legionellales bacterium]
MSEKLQKLLAQAGLGSRRQMEQWIAQGRVSVNGEVATLGDRVTVNDHIRVDGQVIKLHDQTKVPIRILLYNKPDGEICTQHDPQQRRTVFDSLQKFRRGRWVMIGRLDINTSGLLLFTNHGELANRFMHPKFQLEREYAVRLLGQPESNVLTRLCQGVRLEDGMARFDRIDTVGGRGVNQWYHVVTCEGRQRIVRRLWESQGFTVSRLIRVRFGDITLPASLPRGRWLELSAAQVTEVLANMSS